MNGRERNLELDQKKKIIIIQKQRNKLAITEENKDTKKKSFRM